MISVDINGYLEISDVRFIIFGPSSDFCDT